MPYDHFIYSATWKKVTLTRKNLPRVAGRGKRESDGRGAS